MWGDSPVARLQQGSAAIFAEAKRGLLEEFRVIVAAQAVRNLKSGDTIRRIARATEDHSRAAVEQARASIKLSRSVVLRSKLIGFEAAGVDELFAAATDQLERLGLTDRAGQVLLREARDRALRPAPKVIEPPGRFPAWVASAGKWGLDNLWAPIVVGIILIVVPLLLPFLKS